MKILSRIAKIRIATVSYLNTVPFIFGFDNSPFSELFDLKLGNPNKCYQLFQKEEVDVALVPVGSLPLIGECRIIGPYCLGADGQVRSVFVFSDSTVQDAKTIYFDLHSLTSNKLTEILCKEFWKISPLLRFPETYPPELKKKEAIVAIGDKTFRMSDNFRHRYDLSEQWKQYTGKGFVFAVWVTKTNLHPTILKAMNEALYYGVSNIPESVVYAKPDVLPVDDTLDYLKNKIHYEMTDTLFAGMKEFLNKIMPRWQEKIEII